MARQQQMDKDGKSKIWVIAPDGTLVSGPGMPAKEESKEGESKETDQKAGESQEAPKEG